MTYSCRFKNYYAVFMNFYIIHQLNFFELLPASLSNHAKVADFKTVFSEYILNKLRGYLHERSASAALLAYKPESCRVF